MFDILERYAGDVPTRYCADGNVRCKARPLKRHRPPKDAHKLKHRAAKMKKTSRRRNRQGV